MSTPFNIPASSAIDPETGLLPKEGWHDATMTAREPKLSRSGQYKLMSAEFTIDNGKFLGTKLSFTFTFGLNTGDGEANLLKFLEADGTHGTPAERWVQYPTLEEFVMQFPANKLRAGVKIIHTYSFESDNGWENTTKERWETINGKKNIRAEIMDFRGAAQPSNLKSIQVEQPKLAFAENGKEEFVPSDDLPF